MQETHPKIHDIIVWNGKQEVQMIQQGLMKPSAQVIKVDNSANIKNDGHDRDNKQERKNGGGRCILT